LGAIGRIDVHNSGTEVGQHHGYSRAGNLLTEINNAHAF
jgi:hypothetical protein